MTSLSERVEGLTGGDRETDAAVWRELLPTTFERWQQSVRPTFKKGLSRDDIVAELQKRALAVAPPYSASIDAALSLLPEGWRLTLVEDEVGPQPFWWCQLRKANKGDWTVVCAEKIATPALALLAAILRARGL